MSKAFFLTMKLEPMKSPDTTAKMIPMTLYEAGGELLLLAADVAALLTAPLVAEAMAVAIEPLLLMSTRRHSNRPVLSRYARQVVFLRIARVAAVVLRSARRFETCALAKKDGHSTERAEMREGVKQPV